MLASRQSVHQSHFHHSKPLLHRYPHYRSSHLIYHQHHHYISSHTSSLQGQFKFSKAQVSHAPIFYLVKGQRNNELNRIIYTIHSLLLSKAQYSSWSNWTPKKKETKKEKDEATSDKNSQPPNDKPPGNEPDKDNKNNDKDEDKAKDKDKDKDKDAKKIAEDSENKQDKKDKDRVKEKSKKKDKEKEKDKDGEKEKEKDKSKKSKDDKSEDKEEKPSKIDEFFDNPTLVWGSVVAITALLVAMSWMGPKEEGELIAYQKFLDELLKDEEVEYIQVINKSVVNVYLKSDIAAGKKKAAYHFHIGSIDAFELRLEEVQASKRIPREKYVSVSYIQGNDQHLAISTIQIAAGVMLFFWGTMIARSLLRGARMAGAGGGGGAAGGLNGIFAFGRIGNKKAQRPNIKFKDVAGLPEAKQEIYEFVSFLKEPKRFAALGAKIPKGALLVGPPGTGKTLLAKAAAGEADVDFFSVNGADFVEMYGGVGASRVRDLFKQARQSKPCIIFIDEIDAVGRSRGKRRANEERENTLNQLLVELDGFNTAEGIVVLAGTNRVDILDKALLRSGRFDRQISVDHPDRSARVEIFEVHLKNLKLSDTIPFFAKKLAVLTPGFTGADISNVCNEAALIAARHDKNAVELVDFEQAIDRVIGGIEKKSKVLSPEEKKRVAYHESGHAIAGWFLEHADPLLKVSIVPRGVKSLGYTQYIPKQSYLGTSEELLDKMAMALAGRAAEELFLNSISSGAADDLQRVTNMAYRQIISYGMNARIGPIAYSEYRKGQTKLNKPFSEHTSELVDQEVRQTISIAYGRVTQLLQQKKEGFQALANTLIDKEVLRHEDLIALLGPRPFKLHPQDNPFEEGSGTMIDTPQTPQSQK